MSGGKKLPVLTNEKTVLPEVLPDPRRPSASPSSGPRSRTLAHMQRMLAIGTAVTVAGTGSISCGKTEVKSGGVERKGCGSSLKGSSSSGESSSSGYAVVDPMPTPAYCPGIAQLVTPTAALVEGTNGGAPVLIVTFSKPKGRDDWKYVSDAPATAYGGTILNAEAKPDGSMMVTMQLAPGMADASTPSVSVSVKGTCDKGPSTLSASVSWTGAVKTAKPLVYVNEY